MFHDCVEVTFAQQLVTPSMFNIWDFQGERANEDFDLICDLLENLPMAYLLVQVHEETYCNRLFEAL